MRIVCTGRRCLSCWRGKIRCAQKRSTCDFEHRREKGGFILTDKHFIRTLEGILRQRAWRTSADLVFRHAYLRDWPRSFIWVVQIFSDKTARSLKSSALVTCPVHAEVLNFSKEYRKRLIPIEHSLLALLPVDTEKSEDRREAEMRAPWIGIQFSTPQVLDDEASTQGTCDTEETDRKMRTLHQSMPMVLEGLEQNCTAGFLLGKRGMRNWTVFIFLHPIVSIFSKVRILLAIESGRLWDVHAIDVCVQCSIDDSKTVWEQNGRYMSSECKKRGSVETYSTFE